LTGGDSDQWTWDDDYNPAVRVSSMAACGHICMQSTCHHPLYVPFLLRSLPLAPDWGYHSCLSGACDINTWCFRATPQARVAAAAQELPPTPRQQMLAQQAAAASQQLPTVITRLPEQFSAQVCSWCVRKRAVMIFSMQNRYSRQPLPSPAPLIAHVTYGSGSLLAGHTQLSSAPNACAIVHNC
jgi:hypothetical protein